MKPMDLRVNRLKPGDDGKRKVVDIIEFVGMLSGSSAQPELEMVYPELLNEEIDSMLAIEMYQRFARRSLDAVERYPLVKVIVSYGGNT